MKNFDEQISQLQKMIDESESITFFTGAGISTLSGIPDFRGKGGLYRARYNGKKPENILHRRYFAKHPNEFYEFYKDKMLVTDKEPNVIHLYIAELEKMGKQVTVVTQNIDGLHEKAGSSHVYNLHGSIHRNFCMDCGKEFTADYMQESTAVPCCDTCGGMIKPGITLYGEYLDMNIFKQARKDSHKSDTLIVMGSSLVVYPASEIVNQFRGKNLVILNMKRTKFDFGADLVIHDDFLKIFNTLLKGVQHKEA